MLIIIQLGLLCLDPSTLRLGTPPIEIQLTSLLNNHTINLSDRVEDTFCFFIRPSDERCSGTLELAELLSNNYDVIIIVSVESAVQALQIQTSSSLPKGSFYIARKSATSSLNMTYFPLLFCYKNKVLHFRASSVFSSKDVQEFVQYFNMPSNYSRK